MTSSPPLALTFFDGRSARGIAAHLQRRGDEFVLLGADGQSPLPGVSPAAANALNWPEPTSRATRTLNWPGGGQVRGGDAAAWDAWAQAHGGKSGLVQRAQSRWAWVLVALLMSVGLGYGVYAWGVPALGKASLAFIPHSADEAIGETVRGQIEGRLLLPSRLSPEVQQRWTGEMAAMVKAAYAGRAAPTYRLEFRRSRIGPNAFALPGGTIVITDELINLANTAPQRSREMLLGVLAHELGHVERRHGMRHLVTSSILGAVSALALGDMSSVIAAVPAWLGQAKYSRDVEREADEISRGIMARSGVSPLGMVSFFDLVRNPPLAHRTQTCQDEARETLTQARKKANDAAPLTEPEVEQAAAPCIAEAKTAHAQGKASAKPAGEDLWSGIGIAISSHPADAERRRAFEAAAKP